MKCPRCQHENPAAVKFCGECGTRLETLCSACGDGNPPSNKFCHQCGAPLAITALAGKFISPESYTPRHLAEKILTSRAALEGERKQVTVLFCDIAGSTSLADRLGPEAMHGLLSDFFEMSLAEVHRYEGTINQFLGDGFMALFGAPVAHEDHATRAILAAHAIQRAVRDRQPRTAHEIELSVRIGLHTGAVVVGSIGDDLRMDYTAVGDTTHLAARLQHAADPGTIVVSEATHGLVAAYVESTFLGQREVKGLARQAVYRVDRLKSGAARFDMALRRGLTPLVGRQRELDTLKRCCHEARAGAIRVIHLMDEAGLGKSRRLYELSAGPNSAAVTLKRKWYAS